MKLSRILAILLSLTLLIGISPDIEMSARKSKARTTQVKSSKNKRNKKSRNKSKSSKSKKGSKSSRNSGASSRWLKTQKAPVAETASNDSLTLLVNSQVLKWIPQNLNPGGLRVNLVSPDNSSKTTKVRLNENFTYLPVTKEFIHDLEGTVRKSLPDSIRDFSLSMTVGGKSLAYFINKIDRLPPEHRQNTPFVRPLHPDVNATKGMEGDIVALWHSHGRYFKNGAWTWQRPLLFQTTEDIYTMGYVLPYIVPMLENAGAYTLLPRERDTNTHEVIVDNDLNPDGQLFSQTYYKEQTGNRKWENGQYDGFIYDLPDFRDTENPFEVGTYRQTTTIRSGRPSIAAWYADIPQDGQYAIYVSYKTLPNSTTDARYTVNYSGGSKEFLVNQTMGGSTWIYLGTFPLEKGYSATVPVVMLTNVSDHAADKILTADAVKIGGGMGNIARSAHRSDIYYDPSTPLEEPEADDDDDTDVDTDNQDDDTADENSLSDTQPEAAQETPKPAPAPAKQKSAPVFRTSGYPRFLEGARYWLHWAGMPEYVYSPYHGKDDYKDDYTGRAIWVNYLAGGSRVLPDEKGLNIPVDVTMALHTDAGKRADDSTVGTLGIYYSQNGASYDDGTPRINSRMLTDLLMRQITGDIRQTYEPNWKRRSMWDKSYVEARIPEVPTALIELLSHQNFGDMQYGLDPGFRFLVGRSIYKALARFIAQRKDREVVIQPLPVKNFAITKEGKSQYRLQWEPTPDKLEPTAMPTKYIVYERSQGNLGFRKIGETHKTHFDVRLTDHDIHSFKIIAANDGGVSFPSEILAVKEGADGKTPILIINAFTRLSAPATVNTDGRAGFDAVTDFGVPYLRDISFSGYQQEFRRSAGNSHGLSSNNYATQIIAGNTFDYPATHGAAIAPTSQGFVSTSVGAVENGHVKLKDYKAIDLILGKQKEGKVGSGLSGWNYKTFTPALQSALSEYLDRGGNLLVSGQYVASDLFTTRSDNADHNFAHNVLGIDTIAAHERIKDGRIDIEAQTSKRNFAQRRFSYNNTLNDKMYIVENPDVIQPSDENSEIFMRFQDNGGAAGILRKEGKSRVAVMTVPFETINDANERNRLMKEILNYFNVL